MPRWVDTFAQEGNLEIFAAQKEGIFIPFLRSKSLKFPSMEGCPEGGVVKNEL